MGRGAARRIPLKGEPKVAPWRPGQRHARGPAWRYIQGMKSLHLSLAAVLLSSSCAWASPSSVASSALDSLSTSVGASSDAISGLSNSSSGGGKKTVDAGPYRVLALHPAGGEHQWVALQGAEAHNQGVTWRLKLPQAVVDQVQPQAGQVWAVSDRAYGHAVAQAPQAAPFFVLVNDAWAGGLSNRAVTP